MDTTLVIEQMLVILILIALGAFLYKKGFLADKTVKQISWIIINVTNPAILLSSAIEEDAKIPPGEIAQVFAISIAAYLLAGIFGWIIGCILRKDSYGRTAIMLMTVFANVGFIGIPLALATLGTRAMVYVSINNLIYCILFYSVGMALIKRSAPAGEGGGQDKKQSKTAPANALLGMINAGTISAVLTVCVYLFKPPVWSVISDPLLYAGRCTTFLSMLVLGVSVASSSIREFVTDVKLWVFVILRGVAVPVIAAFILSFFISDDFMLSTVLLLLAVPAGNMPMIVSRQLGLDDTLFSRGIIMSTLVSVVTIPFVVVIFKGLHGL
ncbi:MAG: AEC family transporter [Lachnospiraceae bacterium]|nr:AEC family transporter [Lachnospiraceae bacterium]